MYLKHSQHTMLMGVLEVSLRGSVKCSTVLQMILMSRQTPERLGVRGGQCDMR
jgi:hypothetical protein